jgi:hypothetical protein
MSELRRSVIWEVEFYPTARTTDIAALDPRSSLRRTGR